MVQQVQFIGGPLAGQVFDMNEPLTNGRVVIEDVVTNGEDTLTLVCVYIPVPGNGPVLQLTLHAVECADPSAPTH